MKIALILSTFALFAYAKLLIAESNLIEIINQLNENINIEWNLIITPAEFTTEFEDGLRRIKKPVIIVTHNMEMEVENGEETQLVMKDMPKNIFLYEQFSENILTIVYVGDSGKKYANETEENNFSYMANIAKCHLRKLHFVHIIWIVEEADFKELHEFAQQCWEFGFTKVLFYANNSLYVYDRFPTLNVKKLASLEQYYQREEIRNFHQYPLKFPITSSPPRCYRFTDRHGEMVYTGYMYNILTTFIQRFNFSFIEYPHSYEDDDKEHLQDALVHGVMDFSSFPTYPNRSFDASDVLWNAHTYMLVPNAEPIPKYQYFLRPFDGLIWMLYCLVIFGASLDVAAFVFVEYYAWDLSKSFMYICSVSLYQYQLPIPVRSWRFNLLYILLIVYNFIMINYYLCMLSSMLVSTIYERQINTVEELAQTNLRFKVTQADMDYFKQLPDISPSVLRLFRLEDGIVLDNLRRNLSTTVIHGAFEDKLRFFMYQQRYLKVPRLHLIDSVLYSAPINFAVRHNLPYIELFNRYLRNLWASGILWQKFLEIEWSGILSGEIRYFKDEEFDERLLTLEYFYSPLGLYCAGVVLSAFVFVVEILYFKYCMKHNY